MSAGTGQTRTRDADCAAAAEAVRSRLLRHHDFRLLWIGETTSRFGTGVTTVSLPLVAVATLHADVLSVSLLTAATWLPWLLIGIPAGAWVDRWACRPVMMACNVLSMLLYVSVPLAAWLGALTITYLLVVALLNGAANVFFTTAYQSYLPRLLDKQDLMEGNAKLQGSDSVSRIAGPSLGGLIAQGFGAVGGLLVDACTYLVSTLCLARVRKPESRPERRGRRHLLRELPVGLKFAVRDIYLRTFALYGIFCNFALIALQAVQIPFLSHDVGVSAGAVGAVLATGSCGGFLGAAVARRVARRLGSARGVLVSVAVALPCGLLIPLASDGFGLVLPMLGGFVMIAGVVISNIIVGSFRQGYCPSEILGRVTSSVQLINYGMMPLGAVLSGMLATTLGARTALWISAGALALCGLILLASPLRGLRDLPTEQAVAA